MDLHFYKVLHLVGLILLFAAIGAMTIRKGDPTPPKFASVLHGIAVLVMLVSGFGMLAKLGIHWPWPTYILAKLGVWLVLGALPLLVKKNILPGFVGLLAGAALGGLAGWLAITKPDLF